MTEWRAEADVEYGISNTSRMLLVCAFVLFVVGGSLSVAGVAEEAPGEIYAGLAVSIVALGMYTLIVMFSDVRGPPSGFELQGMECLRKVKPATFRPAPESQALFITAFVLFSVGCIGIVLGFGAGVRYVWIPGYIFSIGGFLLYTAVVMYGPVTVKPGALIVAFPDDCLPVPGNASVETPPEMRKRRLRRNTMMDAPGRESRATTYMSGYESRTSVSPGRTADASRRGSVYQESRLERTRRESKYDESKLDYSKRGSKYQDSKLDYSKRGSKYQDSKPEYSRRESKHQEPRLEYRGLRKPSSKMPNIKKKPYRSSRI